MDKVSVVINTLNEENNLPRAIASVKELADEVIVVDMESSDATAQIAKKMGAKVFLHKKTGYVEPARNFALRQAQGPWLFVLDADEEITKNLVLEIQKILKNPKANYFRIPRKNIIFGKWMRYSRWWPDYNIRLFKKGTVSWNEVIHAVPMTQGIGADLDAKEDLAIVHHNYDTVEQYIERMNRYTSQHAGIRISEGYKFSWKDTITKPLNEFCSRYFFGEGYKDGLHGLALSLLQAFSELTLYLKIWQKEKFLEKDLYVSDVVSLMRDEEKEIHYWQNDALYKQSGKLVDRLRRKLKI